MLFLLKVFGNLWNIIQAFLTFRKNFKTDPKKTEKDLAQFVISMGGLKQNVNSLLTHVSDTVFHALSHGSLHFVLLGSFDARLFQKF